MSTVSDPHRVVMSFASVILAAIVLAGCLDDSRRVTAPPGTLEERVASNANGEHPPNAAAGLVFCDLAVRTPSGRYRTRTLPIKVPRDAFDPNGKTVKVGFRGWVTGSPDPTRLAVCRVPDTQAAMEFFKSAFSPNLTDRARGTSPADETTTIEPNVITYDGDASTCDLNAPVDWGCGCTTGSCGGWGDGEKTFDGPAPSSSLPTKARLRGVGAPSFDYDDGWPDDGTGSDGGTGSGGGTGSDGGTGSADGTGYDVPEPYCYGQTDYPHPSGTPGYFGNVNVHGRTVCDIETSITVLTTLGRRSCFFIFCWWGLAGDPGYLALFGTWVETNAASLGCTPGWYRGLSSHTASYPGGMLIGETDAYDYIYCDPALDGW